MSEWWSKTQSIVLVIQWSFGIWYRNHKESMKWCDLISPGDPEPQALNLIQTSWTSHVFCWSIYVFLRRDAICTMLRRRLDGDNEVNWRHAMPSDIIYAYSRKGAMLDRLDMTLLLNNESLGNRLWWYRKMKPRHTFWKTSDESKSFKNNMSVLPGRMLLLTGRMRSLWLLMLTYNNNWRSWIWVFESKSYAILTISDLSARLSVNRLDWYITLLLAAKQSSRPCWRPEIFSTSIFFWVRARNNDVLAVLTCSLESYQLILFNKGVRLLDDLFLHTKSLIKINACQIFFVLWKYSISFDAHYYMCLSQSFNYIVFQTSH